MTPLVHRGRAGAPDYWQRNLGAAAHLELEADQVGRPGRLGKVRAARRAPSPPEGGPGAKRGFRYIGRKFARQEKP